MNLNAKRQGITPLCLQNTREKNTLQHQGDKSTQFAVNGLQEHQQFIDQHIQSQPVKAIFFRSNLINSSFNNILFANSTLNRCYLENLIFEDCVMRNVWFSYCVIVQPVVLRRCNVAEMRLLNVHRRMFVFEECTGVGELLIS